ncbi:MAG: ABC transporter ATP-binding protein [Bacteroidales bacterium]|nr:ABC transporter ATP-binding protein [Bacteroidales bacterium]
MVMIKLENISKKFGAITALDNISLEIQRSELFGLIGPDGAGKTTLFRLISSLLLPDRGKIEVMGYDTVTDYRRLRSNIGYMPGRFSLYHDLTVEENLSFYATIFGTTVKANYHLIKDIYSHIEPFNNRRAGKLSGGMKQKLALCCALIHAPKLIILDEPTTGVDAVSRTEFWEMLKKLQKEGISILVSTPYMDEAMLCDRVALIQKGQILAANRPSDIISGFEKKMFAVRGDEKFRLLQELRSFRSVDTVWPFGETIHISFKNNCYDSDIEEYLEKKGHEKLAVSPVKPGIEDVFLELMSRDNYD